MELISITPKNMWEEMYKTKHVMLLAHLAEDEEYVRLANSHPECYKICDNSIIEIGETFTIENEFKAAEKLGAQELILPDGFPNQKHTIELVLESLDWIKKNNKLGRFKLMAVCHAQNKEEFIEIFNLFNSIPEINVLGIPKVIQTWLPTRNRLELAPIFTQTDKEIHLLGEWFNLQNIVEIANSKYSNKIRSCDTCLPALEAIQNKHIWEDREGTIILHKEYPELTKEKYDKVLEEYNNKIKIYY